MARSASAYRHSPGRPHVETVERAHDDEIAPADLRHLFPHPDNSLRPIQQRLRMPALYRSIDMLISVRAAGDDSNVRLAALREAALRFVRPLHRCTCAILLW